MQKWRFDVANVKGGRSGQSSQSVEESILPLSALSIDPLLEGGLTEDKRFAQEALAGSMPQGWISAHMFVLPRPLCRSGTHAADRFTTVADLMEPSIILFARYRGQWNSDGGKTGKYTDLPLFPRRWRRPDIIPAFIAAKLSTRIFFWIWEALPLMISPSGGQPDEISIHMASGSMV